MLEEDSGIASQSLGTGQVQRGLPPVAAAADVHEAIIHGVQETLDVRKVMAMAGSRDSLVQLSTHLDQTMPGADTVHSIRGKSTGRRATLKRKAAEITRSSCETFSFLTTKCFPQKDAADLFTTFCNVSLICLFCYCFACDSIVHHIQLLNIMYYLDYY